MYQIPSFLKRDKDALLFNGEGEFIFYVPEDYFNTKNAFMVGEYVNIIGILDYTIIDKNGRNNGLNPFSFPTVMLTKPSSIKKIKNIKLIKTAEIQDYRELHYKKDDAIIVTTKVPQNIQNTEDVIKLLLITGHIPPTIPYDKIQDYFIESIKLNGSSFNADLHIIGVLISEACRSKKNIEVPFRLAKDDNMLNYKSICIQDSPRFISPFTSIISENWDKAVINASLNKDKEVYTPMEKILMGSE